MKTSLAFDSDIAKISSVEKFIDSVCFEYKISEDVYGNILIATIEAVKNAIEFGNNNDKSKSVAVTAYTADNSLVISVKDSGKGFDYDNLPDPTLPENIEKLSGRGVFLIKNLSDKTEFLDNGSRIKMTFNLV
ncbi:MAG: ATP-binding protein [Bacteroidales bacterium]|nr:ATP-binding protein [Bacteroidales bacterium]MBQ5451560.1 ATP-binding protein [Bacteroidales bacterium]MBR4268147.1 ATP-binding protein [Bacteroidales bacterium]MBR4676387.1 ATP-binding protein [Bacteroidales bacterium]MEE3447063.1 ATP-binding protein [Bacteroidales bacterium]